MRFDRLQGWLDWIETCHPAEVELGLDRIARVAGQLGLDVSGSKVITVAGTNGKGSCVAALNALLLDAGLTVGCYTSPHFIQYNERIVINGEPVSDQSLIASFQRIDQARQGVDLTYFEFGTLAALDIFQRSQLDVWVLEVGLGGRLDAVNLVDADIAIITSIAIDHVDWLGSDREQIGIEKAGVFRSGRPAICADPEPPASIAIAAQQCAAPLYQLGERFSLEPSGAHWHWRGVDTGGHSMSIANLLLPQLPIQSIAAALQALALLNIPVNNPQCLQFLALPGRFQQLKLEGHQLILDVAHNPAAAAHLTQQLLARPCKGRTFALMAVMSDKDVAGMVQALAGVFDGWFLADLKDSPRAMPASELADSIHHQGQSMISVSKNVRQAYRRLQSLMGPEDRLVVVGSFLTVAEILKIQQRQPVSGEELA